MLKVIVSVLLLAFFSSVIGYQQLQATIQTPLQIADNTQFEVKKGTGFNKLCRQWQQQQWVEDCWRFQILAKLDPTLTDLKAGLYELSSDSVLNPLIGNFRILCRYFSVPDSPDFGMMAISLSSSSSKGAYGSLDVVANKN